MTREGADYKKARKIKANDMRELIILKEAQRILKDIFNASRDDRALAKEWTDEDYTVCDCVEGLDIIIKNIEGK